MEAMTYARPPRSWGARIDGLRDRSMQSVRVDLGGGRTVPVDARNTDDLSRISWCVTEAQTRKMHEDKTPIAFKGADNKIYMLTAAEMMAVGSAVFVRGQQIFAQAWAAKEIPPDDVGGDPVRAWRAAEDQDQQ